VAFRFTNSSGSGGGANGYTTTASINMVQSPYEYKNRQRHAKTGYVNFKQRTSECTKTPVTTLSRSLSGGGWDTPSPHPTPRRLRPLDPLAFVLFQTSSAAAVSVNTYTSFSSWPTSSSSTIELSHATDGSIGWSAGLYDDWRQQMTIHTIFILNRSLSPTTTTTTTTNVMD